MRESLRRALWPVPAGARGPQAGLLHFTRESDGRLARYHLRVEADGAGTLIANASAVVRLSPTGVAIARAVLEGRTDEAARAAAHEFRGASTAQVDEDVRRVRRALDELADPHGRYPLLSLDDPGSSLHRRTLSAPLAADLDAFDAEATGRLLRALWDAGVPQVVLRVRGGTAGLVRLVELAEDLGMIAGVSGRASDLGDGSLLDELAGAGLDHLDLGFAGPEPEVHDALFGDGDLALAVGLVERCHRLELCPIAVTPLVAATLLDADRIAAEVARHRFGAWAVFAIASLGESDGAALAAHELRQAAATAEELADAHGLNLLWAPPLERDPRVALAEQAAGGPRTAAEGGVRVEPDGTLLPPVGPAEPVGSLLEDAWATIWAHEAFGKWRESADEPARCEHCPGLAVCAGGCPADPQSWARVASGEEDR